MTEVDHGLEALLDLDGEVFPMENGYWTKIEAKKVEPNDHIPHGIKYTLTLHDKFNRRVIGYDNAHGVKTKKHGARRVVWDHKHQNNHISKYEFENAGKLLEDFWDDVDRVLNQITRSGV